jgi:hypothetical protein
MQPHVRNDVKQSVGLVVTSDWVEKIDVRSIRLSVVSCVNLGCYKPLSGETEKALIFV